MLLWRLSGRQHARAFDGGYGLLFDGRWNTVGHAVTYCATSPSLCVLEKLVHVEDPALLPELIMVAYEAPDALPVDTVTLDRLSHDWQRDEAHTHKNEGMRGIADVRRRCCRCPPPSFRSRALRTSTC